MRRAVVDVDGDERLEKWFRVENCDSLKRDAVFSKM
jgi:hypothetical protein